MKAFYLAAVAAGAMSVALAQVSPEELAAHHPDQAATSKADSSSKQDTAGVKSPSTTKPAP